MNDIYKNLKLYQSKGTNFGDGLCSGAAQSNANSSRGVRTHIVKISFISPLASEALLTQTFSSDTYLNLKTMVATDPFAVKLVEFSDITAVQFDVPRKFKIFTGSITNFTAKISGFNSFNEKICTIISTTNGSIEVSNFALLTSIKIYNFSSGSPVVMSLATMDAIEVPTTDIGCVASFFSYKDSPNYVKNSNDIFSINTNYDYANKTTNKLPYVTLDLGTGGSSNLVVLSLNTGFGANIDLNESVINNMPIEVNKNYDPSMISGITNTNISSWEGWKG